MRYIFSLLFCAILQTGFSQMIKTVGISYTNGTPVYTPAKAGSWLALDTVTWKYYTYNGSTWLSDGYRIQTISGCSAPGYTPTKFQSLLVINACTVIQGGPELYYYTGGVWIQINEGAVYTAGTGIAISGGNVISNILPNKPDSTFSLTAGQYWGKAPNSNVYKNGTLGIGTSDTTGVFNIGNNSATKYSIISSGENPYLFKIKKHPLVTSSKISDFNIVRFWETGGNPSGTDVNNVWMGFNLNRYGLPENTSQASCMMIGLDNNHQEGVGTPTAFEQYLMHVKYPNGRIVVPWLGFYSNDTTTMKGGFQRFEADNIVYRSGNTRQDSRIDVFGYGVNVSQAAGYGKGSHYLDTAGIYLYKSFAAGLYGRKFDNSGFISLIKTNSGNEIIIGDGTEAKIVATNHLKVSGTGLIENSGQDIQIGNAAHPTRVVMENNADALFTLTKTGATYNNTLSINGTDFYYQSSSGAKPFTVSLAAPQNSLLVGSGGNISLGAGVSPFSKIDIQQTSNSITGGILLRESGFSGKYIALYSNADGNLALNRSGTIQTVQVGTTSTPEGSVLGFPGDISLNNLTGGIGVLYGKYSGTNTNTGWGKFLNLRDPNTATSGQVLGWNGVTWLPVTIIVTGGTYTPTLTGVTNVTSSTAKNCQYTRNGNVVTVFGSLDVTTTLAIATEVGISLPIASALAVATDMNGTANASSAIASNGYLEADVTNDRAALKFIGLSIGGAGTIFFSFSYTVL